MWCSYAIYIYICIYIYIYHFMHLVLSIQHRFSMVMVHWQSLNFKVIFRVVSFDVPRSIGQRGLMEGRKQVAALSRVHSATSCGLEDWLWVNFYGLNSSLWIITIYPGWTCLSNASTSSLFLWDFSGCCTICWSWWSCPDWSTHSWYRFHRILMDRLCNAVRVERLGRHGGHCSLWILGWWTYLGVPWFILLDPCLRKNLESNRKHRVRFPQSFSSGRVTGSCWVQINVMKRTLGHVWGFEGGI